MTSNQLQPIVQGELAGIAGAQVVAFQPPPLPGSTGLPIQFVINTTGPFEPLNDVAQKFLQEALATGRFIFLNTDLKIDAPQATVVIDRDKASQLGLKMSDIGAALGSMLGGGYVNYFALDGRSYQVIPQVQQTFAAEHRPDPRLSHPRRRRRVGAALDGGQDRHQGDPAVAEPLPAAQQRHHPGRGLPRRVAGRGAADPAGAGGADLAAGLLDRLRRRLAAVHPGDSAASSSPSPSR